MPITIRLKIDTLVVGLEHIASGSYTHVACIGNSVCRGFAPSDSSVIRFCPKRLGGRRPLPTCTCSVTSDNGRSDNLCSFCNVIQTMTASAQRVYLSLSLSLCIYTYIYIYIHIYIYIYTGIYTNIHICIYIYTHMCVYVYIYICTYTHYVIYQS